MLKYQGPVDTRGMLRIIPDKLGLMVNPIVD